MRQTLKKSFKKLKKRLLATMLPDIIPALMRLLYSTLRVDSVGLETPIAFMDRGQPVIMCFWHGMILMASFPYRDRGIHVLVSQHGDGELIGRIVRQFGFSLVKGSSTRGGKEALKELESLVKNGSTVALTPDGPRGPVEELKPGVAHLARATGAPVIPGAYSGSRLRVLKTWDRFRIPYPFSKIVYVVGEPLYYREGEEFEDFRLRIENALKDVRAKADAHVGR